MERWQEEWEVKQAEFMRCINSFKTMGDVWSQLASTNIGRGPGYVSYAKKKSALYAEMERSARHKFIRVGYGDRLSGDGRTLVDHILRDRGKFDASVFSADHPEEGEEDVAAGTGDHE